MAQQHEGQEEDEAAPPLRPNAPPSSHHHHHQRALFFVNESIPDLPSVSSPPQLSYDPCAAGHAAAYLNRQARGGVVWFGLVGWLTD